MLSTSYPPPRMSSKSVWAGATIAGGNSFFLFLFWEGSKRTFVWVGLCMGLVEGWPTLEPQPTQGSFLNYWPSTHTWVLAQRSTLDTQGVLSLGPTQICHQGSPPLASVHSFLAKLMCSSPFHAHSRLAIMLHIRVPPQPGYGQLEMYLAITRAAMAVTISSTSIVFFSRHPLPYQLHGMPYMDGT